MKKKINLEKDIIDFLELCNKYMIKYLLFGGYAVSINSYLRSLKDIDVCIEMSYINASNMGTGNKRFWVWPFELKQRRLFKKTFYTAVRLSTIAN